jgi:hypothetical protein
MLGQRRRLGSPRRLRNQAWRYPASGLSAKLPQNAERFGRSRDYVGGPPRAGLGARVLRLLPAALAAYEFRYLIAHVADLGTVLPAAGSRPVALCGLLSLVVLAGFLLREGGRGIAARVPRPGWSLRFASSWALYSAAIAVLLFVPEVLREWSSVGSVHPLAHSVLAGGWSAVPAVLMVGLVLTASLHGVRWLLRKLVRPQPRASRAHASRMPIRRAAAEGHPAAAPLTAGWSDRGPPAAAPAVS